MPLPATIEICQKDLFTAEDELKRKYDEITVRRLLRLREMYAWAVANPDAKDRQFVEVLVSPRRVYLYYNNLIISFIFVIYLLLARNLHGYF